MVSAAGVVGIAAAPVAAAAIAAAAAAAAAEEQQENDDDDPAAVAAKEAVVIAHKKNLQRDCRLKRSASIHSMQEDAVGVRLAAKNLQNQRRSDKLLR